MHFKKWMANSAVDTDRHPSSFKYCKWIFLLPELIFIPVTVREECVRVLQYSALCVTVYRKVHSVAMKTHYNAIPSFCSLSCLPTLCRYLETFPTVYCDKLNTKL